MEVLLRGRSFKPKAKQGGETMNVKQSLSEPTVSFIFQSPTRDSMNHANTRERKKHLQELAWSKMISLIHLRIGWKSSIEDAWGEAAQAMGVNIEET